MYDVVQLAHSYGVSVPSTLYRLRNLKLVSEPEFERLRTMDGEGRSKRIAAALGVGADESLEQRGEFQRRFLALGLEALRREKISQAKFLELAERVGVSQWIAQDLLVMRESTTLKHNLSSCRSKDVPTRFALLFVSS